MNKKKDIGLADAIDKISEFINSGKKVVFVKNEYFTPKSARTAYTAAIKRMNYDSLIRTHVSKGEFFFIRNDILKNENVKKGNMKSSDVAFEIQKFVNSGKKVICIEHEYSSDEVAQYMYKRAIKRLGYGEIVRPKVSKGVFFLFRTDNCMDKTQKKNYGKRADVANKIKEFVNSEEKISYIEHEYPTIESARATYYAVMKQLGYDGVLNMASSKEGIFLIRNNICANKSLNKCARKTVNATNKIQEFINSGEKVVYIEPEYATSECAYGMYNKLIEHLGYSGMVRVTASKADCFLVRNDI